MTIEEKKKYIIKSFSVAPGKKITEMLKRYWNIKTSDKSGEDIIKIAEKIFA